MIQPDAESLNQIGVLVTRPVHQAAPFIEQLLQHGAKPIAFPTIEIKATSLSNELKQRFNNLSQYDLLIFISANAVDHAVKLLKNAGNNIDQAVAAIGQSTASRLASHNITVTIQSDSGYNSEALLNTQALRNIEGKSVLIFRGQGGRELLADTLRARGARVDYAEVYQRCQPQIDDPSLMPDWQKNKIHIVTVTSNETLKNLYHMLDKTGQTYLINTPLVVPSTRCAELAKQLGFNNQVLVADNATDQAMFDTIVAWHHQ